jgi:hypothetical protein
MSTLPEWMQWLQGIALVAIPTIGAWIAYQQVRLGKAKLNLDLYDRRFAVFAACRKLLATGIQHGDVRPSDLQAFYVATADTIFLFDQQMDDYVDGFGETFRLLGRLNDEMNRDNPDATAHARYAEERAAHFQAITTKHKELREKFKPFLKLGML